MHSCAHSARIMGPTHVENVVELAIRTALAYRQPTHVTMPVDIQSMPVDKAKRPKRNIADHVPSLMARGGQLPDRPPLSRPAAILTQADKPFILAAQGALRPCLDLRGLAATLGAPKRKA